MWINNIKKFIKYIKNINFNNTINITEINWSLLKMAKEMTCTLYLYLTNGSGYSYSI